MFKDGKYRCMVCDKLEDDNKGIMLPIEKIVDEEVLSYVGHVQAVKVCKKCHKEITK